MTNGISEAFEQAKKKVFWNGKYWETSNGDLFTIYDKALLLQVKIERERLRAL